MSVAPNRAYLTLREMRSAQVGPTRVSAVRIETLVRIGGTTWVISDAVLDTGAPLLAVPHSTWKLCQNDIQWLAAPNDPSLPSWCKEVTGLGGGKFPARLGSVDIKVVDSNNTHELLINSVTALFADDKGKLPFVLLGMSAIDACLLSVDQTNRLAWLDHPAPPPAP